MYSRISNKSYRDTPFIDKQYSYSNSYTYSSVEDLAKLGVPESALEELVRCRTVGILQSYDTQFYVCDINCMGGVAPDIKIRLSVVYLDSAQPSTLFESIVMPCPIQIFGSLRWHIRTPVIYVKLMQVLSVPRALQMKDIMDQLIVLKARGPKQES